MRFVKNSFCGPPDVIPDAEAPDSQNTPEVTTAKETH